MKKAKPQPKEVPTETLRKITEATDKPSTANLRASPEVNQQHLAAQTALAAQAPEKKA